MEWKDFLEKIKDRTTIKYKEIRATNKSHDTTIAIIMQDLFLKCLMYKCNRLEIKELETLVRNQCNETRKEY
jgi:hypothetical protein